MPTVRVGSATPKLTDDTARYQALIERMRPYAWEQGVASDYLVGDDVLRLLKYDAYFELTGQPSPSSKELILKCLAADRLVQADVGGRWKILNLGAILFAYDLNGFGSALARKAVRFVRYDGTDRASTETHRQDGQMGYAVGFEGLGSGPIDRDLTV